MSNVILQQLREWRESPFLFTTKTMKMKSPNPGVPAGPSKQQRELLGIFGKADKKKITIRSGHGTGKDTCASWCILNFFLTRPAAKIVCTAPTARQLSDILWAELSKWIRRSVFADQLIVQKDVIRHKEAPKEWWIRAVSCSARASKDEQAETLAGFHGDHLLIVVDEASGVPDPVYTPLEGALTQEDNHVLLIGNMTKNSGYFYDTHFHPKLGKDWTKLHWDSRKSTNVTDSMIQYFADKYGEDSNIFRIRVAGEPPLEDETTLIPLSWALQCVGNEIPVSEFDPVYIGADVARYGEDLSVLMPRQGLVINPWKTYNGLNTIDLAANIDHFAADIEADGIAIDEIGVGAGVVDWLYKHGHSRVFGVNVANKSSDTSKFDRLRDELWLSVREKCMKGLYSFPDKEVSYGGTTVNLGHELANELAIPTYDFNRHGGYNVESKKSMKLRGFKSPNLADALCLTEYFHSFSHKVWQTDKMKKRRRHFGVKRPRRHGWMAA